MTNTIHHPSCPKRHDPAAACTCQAPARTADDMALDVVAHANQAWNDFQDNVEGRGTPKGLLAAVLLEADLPGPKAASWGVQA